MKGRFQYILLALVLVVLLWFGMPAWALAQLLGASIILVTCGMYPWLAALMISGTLVAASLLMDRWLRSRLPKTLKYAYKVTFIYFLIVFGSLLPATWLINHGLPSIRQITFNQDKWKSDTYDNTNFPKKVNMIDDLKSHYLKTGMSHEEVVQLLGDCEDSKDSCVINLGPQRDSIFAIDDSWLTLDFKEGKLISFKEWSD